MFGIHCLREGLWFIIINFQFFEVLFLASIVVLFIVCIGVQPNGAVMMFWKVCFTMEKEAVIIPEISFLSPPESQLVQDFGI